MDLQKENYQTKQPKKQSANPTVSVVICAYNAAPYISETLDSLFAQTYSDFEVILVNDGSTDETAAVLTPYLDRIIYHEQANKGPAAARNAAMQLARGEFIAVLDSDDLWLPNYLEKMVGHLQAHPEIDVIYPNAVLFGNSHLNGKIFQDMYPSSHPVTLEKFLAKECIIFGLVTFRREILDRVGVYDEGLRGVEDLDLWLRMLQNGYRFTFTEEVLVKYRRHDSSLSASSTTYFDQVLKAYRKFQASELTTSHQRDLAEAYCRKIQADKDLLLAKQEILKGNHHNATQHLLSVMKFRPTVKLRLALVGLILFPKLLAQLVQKSSKRAELNARHVSKSPYSTTI